MERGGIRRFGPPNNCMILYGSMFVCFMTKKYYGLNRRAITKTVSSRPNCCFWNPLLNTKLCPTITAAATTTTKAISQLKLSSAASYCDRSRIYKGKGFKFDVINCSRNGAANCHACHRQDRLGRSGACPQKILKIRDVREHLV